MIEPKIYPYSRISSTKQAKGQGLTIQEEEALLQTLSERYGLSIYEHRMIDSGKSAFHGHHIKDGQLGGFLKAAKVGEVAPGSILVVSSLDRFSRQDVVQATHDLTAILKQGIGIHSAIEGRTFCDPHGDKLSDGLDIQLAILALERAHGESKTKQARVYKLTDLAISRHQQGERHDSGYANAIKVVGNDVWWVDSKDGAVRPHPIYHPLAREIALKLIDGQSPYKIAEWLNADAPECPIHRSDKREPGAWSIHVLRRFHKTKALIGEKVINGITLFGYYPPLLTEDEYHRLIDARTRRQRPKTTGKATAVSLFAGLKEVVCMHCGAGVHMNREAGGSLNYRCSAHRTEYACVGWSKRAEQIERALLEICLDKTWREPERKSTSQVPVIEGQIAVVDEDLRILGERRKVQGLSPTLLDMFQELDEQKAALSKRLEQAKAEDAAIEVQNPTALQSRWAEVSESILDPRNDEAREYMRELLRDSIKLMTIGRPSHANLSIRSHMMKYGQRLKEEIPSGSARFMLLIHITFVDGTNRRILLTREGIGRVSGSDAEKLSPEIKEHFASIETDSGFFNGYQPRTEESVIRLREAITAMEASDPLPADEYPDDEYQSDEQSAYWGDE
ncbi:recombinase family protein [Aeromonas media]|uniref:recombinase family protein n=1 Tax=Aeromonas TaxID=642 RepID=UPI00215775EF|nr:recombinase family protein [Aeromonas dhakensis]MCR6741004.1 recombinase family protein [Aeromonas dhakensis]